MVFMTRQQEQKLLEDCLAEAQRELKEFRDEGMYLQADLAQADVNAILDKLQADFYSQKGETCTD